jgi:hypothetical protein
MEELRARDQRTGLHLIFGRRIKMVWCDSPSRTPSTTEFKSERSDLLSEKLNPVFVKRDMGAYND